jgi:uncharacterized protein (TIGR02145 family)
MNKFYLALLLLYTAVAYSQKPCPGILSVNYGGYLYHTVQIGSQCWLSENLNIGSMVKSGSDQLNNNTVEKYCYNDQAVNCQKYGALYRWSEAMQYDTTEGSRGICPAGWHLPTLADITKLESTQGHHGFNLINAAVDGGSDNNGFSALLSAIDNSNSTLSKSLSNLWSSKAVNNSQAYYFLLNNNRTVINHSSAFVNSAYSVRCINNLPVSALPVELTSFSASVIKNNVSLKWNTATEINSFSFEIERNEINNNWQKVAIVSASGNSSSPVSYSCTDKVVNSGNYSYRLKMIDVDGSFKYSAAINVLISVPDKFELSQNFPNPFNPSTTISYKVPENILVTIKLYDVLGKEVSTLINEEQSAGIHTVNLNGTGLSSGVYYYQMKAGNFSDSKKINLVK